jgi:hypothetical protein
VVRTTSILDLGVLFSISLIAVPYSIDENVERSTCGTYHIFQSAIQNHKSKIEIVVRTTYPQLEKRPPLC